MAKLIKGVNDLASVNPELIKEWCQDKNEKLTPEKVTYGSNKVVWWKCRKCGHEWQASIHNRNSNHGCPVCYGKFKGDGTINVVYDHEFGHNLLNAIETKIGNRKKLMQHEFMLTVWGKDGSSLKALSSNVDDIHEGFAEGFAAWNGGEQTEFALAFGKFLERWRK